MKSLPSTIALNWNRQFRIVPSKFPPINFFEKLVDAEQMQEAFYLESLTNDRLLEETGDISLVNRDDRISGQGSSIIMAAFTHIGRPSRFTNGSYGVYYAAKELKTAIKETTFHREIFLSYTHEKAGCIDMRVYMGQILKPLHDIRKNGYHNLHHPDDYLPAQSFAFKLREMQSYGIVYNSVRDLGGECIAAFRPTAISIPKQGKHLIYEWNGVKITGVYEKSEIYKS